MAPICPPRGIYAPVVAFFFEDETLDIETLKVHVTRLAEAGVAGLVIQGSNGEAPHLLHSERKEVISTAAAILKQKGRPDAVIIAGCGAQSTRETIQLCQEAQESGADYALVLSPSYWVGAMQPPTIQKFFTDVATASPIPILLYNFPAVTGGIDLDSDLIANLASSNPNKIVGCKLTCGNLGKLHRVAHDKRIKTPFAAFAGKSEFFLHGLVAGSNGLIGAAVNFVPKVHVKLLELYDAGNLAAAQELQTQLSETDWVLVRLGVSGLKAALEKYYQYGGGRSRRPLKLVESNAFSGEKDDILRHIVELEQSL
ncbi:aldolase [Annulohypoxylon truncatum]|uniref:aldolase n=1 Tax=Annulohypoxylon truncatum TaxID=327061 RepID=UPI002008D872|nr:aldolase [Annulohypoxylon truncatum]KAI1206329.1 aldolase [Annulohypoxylon truncatum]